MFCKSRQGCTELAPIAFTEMKTNGLNMPKTFCNSVQDLVLNGYEIGKMLFGILNKNTLANCQACA
jgi:hypothetical protein